MAKPTWVYLVGAARKIWRWSPERREVIRDSTNNEFYICAGTGNQPKHNVKKVQIDHIVPVGKAPKTFKGWDAYYKRLFCPISNLQALCTKCHKAKTKIDNVKTKTKKLVYPKPQIYDGGN